MPTARARQTRPADLAAGTLNPLQSHPIKPTESVGLDQCGKHVDLSACMPMRLSMRRSLTPVLVAVGLAVASGAIWLDWRAPHAGRRASGPDNERRPSVR